MIRAGGDYGCIDLIYEIAKFGRESWFILAITGKMCRTGH